MQKIRLFSVGLGALALMGAAAAQFDGPAPLAWRFLQPSKVVPGGSPLASGNFLYQSIGGRVDCIDKSTGNLVWRFPQLDPIEGAFRHTPILAGGSLLCTGDDGILFAVDPDTGASKWSTRLPAKPLGAPVIVGDAYVCALEGNSLIALKLSDGSPYWTSGAAASSGSTPAPAQATSDTSVFKVYDGLTGHIAATATDVLYFTSKNDMVALNVARRAPDWHQSFTQLPPIPEATVTRESILLISGPYLIALNPATGNARWQVDTTMQLAEPPVTSDTGILVVSGDGKAQVYDQLSHHALMKSPIDLGSLPMVKPTASGNLFIIPTTNGGINLLNPAKADIEWNYIVKPLIETVNTSGANPGGKGGGPGGGGGFGGGGGGFGGGGGGFGGGGQGGPGGNNNLPKTKITYIQASGPAIVDGTTLIMPARDGSILAFDKQLGVDLTPPKVEMLFPNAGDQVSGQPPLFLLFKLNDDDSGLKRDSIKVEVNGQPLDFTLDKEDQVVVMFSLSGKNRPMADGRKEIVVTASDWLGNVVHKSFALTIDNALRPIIVPGQNQNQNGPGGKGGPGGGNGGFGGGGNGGDTGGG